MIMKSDNNIMGDILSQYKRNETLTKISLLTSFIYYSCYD